MVRKEGSNTKPKSTMLEKAIRDLEKTVVECMSDDHFYLDIKVTLLFSVH